MEEIHSKNCLLSSAEMLRRRSRKCSAAAASSLEPWFLDHCGTESGGQLLIELERIHTPLEPAVARIPLQDPLQADERETLLVLEHPQEQPTLILVPRSLPVFEGRPRREAHEVDLLLLEIPDHQGKQCETCRAHECLLPRNVQARHVLTGYRRVRADVDHVDPFDRVLQVLDGLGDQSLGDQGLPEPNLIGHQKTPTRGIRKEHPIKGVLHRAKLEILQCFEDRGGDEAAHGFTSSTRSALRKIDHSSRNSAGMTRSCPEDPSRRVTRSSMDLREPGLRE